MTGPTMHKKIYASKKAAKQLAEKGAGPFRQWIKKMYIKPRKNLDINTITDKNNTLLIDPDSVLEYIRNWCENDSNPKNNTWTHSNEKSNLNPTAPNLYREDEIEVPKEQFHNYIDQLVYIWFHRQDHQCRTK